MSDRQSNDDTLKAAFQALGETSHGEISAADLDLIWRAVSGELPATERRELVDRTATDPALAEAARERGTSEDVVALAAALARPWADVVLSGAATVAQLESNLAALDLAYVAAGRFEAYWENGVKSYDIAAGIVLVREAGGFTNDLFAGGDRMKRGNAILAGAPGMRAFLEGTLGDLMQG